MCTPDPISSVSSSEAAAVDTGTRTSEGSMPAVASASPAVVSTLAPHAMIKQEDDDYDDDDDAAAVDWSSLCSLMEWQEMENQEEDSSDAINDTKREDDDEYDYNYNDDDDDQKPAAAVQSESSTAVLSNDFDDEFDVDEDNYKYDFDDEFDYRKPAAVESSTQILKTERFSSQDDEDDYDFDDEEYATVTTTTAAAAITSEASSWNSSSSSSSSSNYKPVKMEEDEDANSARGEDADPNPPPAAAAPAAPAAQEKVTGATTGVIASESLAHSDLLTQGNVYSDLRNNGTPNRRTPRNTTPPVAVVRRETRSMVAAAARPLTRSRRGQLADNKTRKRATAMAVERTGTRGRSMGVGAARQQGPLKKKRRVQRVLHNDKKATRRCFTNQAASPAYSARAADDLDDARSASSAVEEVEIFQAPTVHSLSKKQDDSEGSLVATPKYRTLSAPIIEAEIPNSFQKAWNRMFDLLLSFRHKNGHCRVPCSFVVQSVKLGTWASNQRHYYNMLMKGRPAPITQERIARLNSIGFQWSCGQEGMDHKAWACNFALLRSFRRKNGHCRVPQRLVVQSVKLGKWASNQRQHYKNLTNGHRAPITQERIDQLRSIGFDWELRLRSKSAGATNGNNIETPERLRKTAAARTKRTCGFHSTTKRRVCTDDDEYEAEEFSPSSSVVMDNGSFPSAVVEVEILQPPTASLLKKRNDSELNLAVANAKQRKGVDGSSTKVSALGGRSSGNSQEEEEWNQFFSLLCEFHRKNGHWYIPCSFEMESFQLGRWVSMQRQDYDNLMKGCGCSFLTEARIDRLNSIDFVWDLYVKDTE